jgi:hypothetical protein
VPKRISGTYRRGGIILAWLCRQKREWVMFYLRLWGSSKSRKGYNKIGRKMSPAANY